MKENKLDMITDAEWEIMRVVWSKKATTSNEIIGILMTKMAWKPSTVKTLLSRLVDKQYVGTEKKGKQFIYTPLVDEEVCINESGQAFLEKICAKKVGGVLESIIQTKELSVTDIERLIQLLEKKKKSAPISVACNCIPGQCTCETKGGVENDSQKVI